MFRATTALMMAAFISLVAFDHAISQTSGTPEDRAKTSAKRPKEDALPRDFLGLADLRAVTLSDIANLERTIKDVEDYKIPQAELIERQLAQDKEQLSRLESEKSTDSAIKAQLTFLKLKVANAYRPSPTADELRRQLTDAKRSLAEKRESASRIQEKISSLLSPEQDFKRTMSLIFAGLIFVVIVVFALTCLDAKIRQAVFSSEAGMQFLTLFSLVIAIILFGITGILEGKELSALLGGLSGYILGRVTPKAKSSCP
jgi:hypothetical protein